MNSIRRQIRRRMWTMISPITVTPRTARCSKSHPTSRSTRKPPIPTVGRITRSPPGRCNFRDQDTSLPLRGGFRWQTDYGLIVNDNYFNRTFDNLFDGAVGQVPFTTDLAVSKLEDQFKIGADNTFRVGFEYRNKTFENNGFNNVIPEQPALEEK